MSVPYISIQEIILGRCLGEGSQGSVYAGSYLETPVAIKQLKDVREMEMSLHIGEHTLFLTSPPLHHPQADLLYAWGTNFLFSVYSRPIYCMSWNAPLKTYQWRIILKRKMFY